MINGRPLRAPRRQHMAPINGITIPSSEHVPAHRVAGRAAWLVAAVVLAVTLSAPQLRTSPVVAAGIPDYRFGVVEAYHAPAAAWELGAGWGRVTFRWIEIQPNNPDEWNIVPISDEALAVELSHGRQVVGLISNTPDWATDWPVGAGVPQGLYLPTDHPNNLWAGFMRSIVGRYAGRIDHWIIWNEPEIPPSPYMTWGGSIDDFVQLQRVAYTVAREANPNAVIHLAGISHYWNEVWFGQLLDALVAHPEAAANDHFFDIATVHIYFRPDAVYDITSGYLRLMRERGLNKPIWIAETNAAPSEDPAWPVENPQFHITLQDQAGYIVQAFSMGIAAGAGRIAVYNMSDDDPGLTANPEPYGLIRADGSRRPAFTAFQVAAAHLSEFTGGAVERLDSVAVVRVDRGPGTTTVAWSRTAEAQQASIPARMAQALRVDATGAASYVYPVGGYYSVSLAGANCQPECLIGGPPVLIVEEELAATEEPTETPTPEPTDTPLPPTPSVTTTPEPTTTPTAVPTATLELPPTDAVPGGQGWLIAVAVVVLIAALALVLRGWP